MLSNTDNAATALLVDIITPDGKFQRALDIPLFERGKQSQLWFQSPSPLQGKDTQLRLSFKDVLGKHYHINYAIQRETEHPHSSLSFTKI
jgi:hypothetical protein